MEKKKYYRGIKLCPKCKGEGKVYFDDEECRRDGHLPVEECPVCEGSGRVKYDTVVNIVIEPYK